MRKKVLIIEDDAAIRAYAVLILKRAAYEVAEAPDGKAGLDRAREFKPDLVVLDLMMPGLHGYEVCSRLRADKSFNGVKVLITSSKSYAADLDAAKSSGADSYLMKPYKAEQLAGRVRDLLEGAAQAPDRGAAARPSAAAPAAAKAPAQGGGVKTDIRVTFWGVRGSTPAPGPSTVRYGGNTSCTEIRFGDELVIVDSGTGIRELGMSLLAEFKEKPITGSILVGHTHWDHIQGFPFFTPLYIPRNHFTVYSVRGAGKSLEQIFKGQMEADYFPVPMKSLACDLRFVELEDNLRLGEVTVRYQFLNHPGVAIGFRFEYLGKVVTYISDHETFCRLSGDNDAARKQDRGIVEFARGSDLLISEAQYDEEEYKLKRGWGHSTFDDAVDRGVASGARQLTLFHHDPVHTDELMDAYLEACRARILKAGSTMLCTAAREGETITL